MVFIELLILPRADRKNISGGYMPLPDGTYPLMGFDKHGPWPGLPGIGHWSAYINNTSGSIGARGGIMLHNDIGSNGTQGCIGVELGGTGTPAEEEFLAAYEQADPTSVRVNIAKNANVPEEYEDKSDTTPKALLQIMLKIKLIKLSQKLLRSLLLS